MARVGVDRQSGQVLTGWAHCVQSIGVILTTAIGTLLMQRDFGSAVPLLQDRPASRPSLVDLFMAGAEALRKWEPGFRLTSIDVVTLGADGGAALSLAGDFFPNGHLGDYSIVEGGKSAIVSVPGLTTTVTAS